MNLSYTAHEQSLAPSAHNTSYYYNNLAPHGRADNMPDEFLVKKITIQSVDMFGSTGIGFIKLKADAVVRQTQAHPPVLPEIGE